MQSKDRRGGSRRGGMRGYGPDRRRRGDGIFLGPDGRRNQRRQRDRRRAIRRSDDMPYESPSHF